MDHRKTGKVLGSFRTLFIPGALLLLWGALLMAATQTQDYDLVETRLTRVHLKNGSVLDANSIRDGGRIVTLVLNSGEIAVRRDAIDRMEPITVRTRIAKPSPPKPAPSMIRPQTASPASSEAARERIEALLGQLRTASDDRRHELLKELVRAARPAISELARKLETAPEQIRPFVAAALIDCKDAATAVAVIPLLQSKRPEVRAEAARVLGFLGEAWAAERMLPLLRDEHPEVRSAAFRGLVALEAREAFRALADCSADPDREVRILALQALPAMADKFDAWFDLIPGWQDAFDRTRGAARRDVVAAMGGSGRKEFARHLVYALSDDSPLVRAAAVTSFARLEGRAAQDLILERLLREEESIVRIALAGAAQTLKIQAAIDPLIPWLDEQDRDVAGAALRALKALTERDFGLESAPWAAWWQKVKPR